VSASRKVKVTSIINQILSYFYRLRQIFWAFKYKPDHSSIKTLHNFIYEDKYPIGNAEMNKVLQALQREFLEKVGLKDLAAIVFGIIYYKKTGMTPIGSHSALVRAYLKTNGIAQELLHSLLFLEKPRSISPSSTCSDNLKTLTNTEFHRCISELNLNGYSMLHGFINDSLLNQVLSDVANIRFQERGSNNIIRVDPNNLPKCSVADAISDDLSCCDSINEITKSKLLLDIASGYLKSDVHLINQCLWYSFPFDGPTSESAQFYHFDLDTLRWLKVFVYLTDVTEENGPHEYVQSSHISGNKSPELLMKGYVRLTDKEIDRHSNLKRIKATGPKGTILLADTRCFHKGNHPINQHRLILQPIYAPSSLSYHQI